MLEVKSQGYTLVHRSSVWCGKGIHVEVHLLVSFSSFLEPQFEFLCSFHSKSIFSFSFRLVFIPQIILPLALTGD